MGQGDVVTINTTLLRNVPQQDRARIMLASVLNAAAEILIEDPLSLSITEIERRTEASKATIYRYFENLDSIVQTLALPYADRAVQRLTDVVAAIDSPFSAVGACKQLFDEVIATCHKDPLARALFITSFNYPLLGKLYNDTVWTLARLSATALRPILNDDEAQHLRKAVLGIHMARSAIDLSLDLSKKEAKALQGEFLIMMFNAAEVNVHRPTPVELDPHVAGVL